MTLMFPGARKLIVLAGILLPPFAQGQEFRAMVAAAIPASGGNTTAYNWQRIPIVWRGKAFARVRRE